MTGPTMLTVTMMVEIAASTSTRITALIAHVIIKKTVLLGLLPLLLETVFVMLRLTMLTVTMMVETVVSPMQYLKIRNILLIFLKVNVGGSSISKTIVKIQLLN